jgi:hypothetical protein
MHLLGEVPQESKTLEIAIKTYFKSRWKLWSKLSMPRTETEELLSMYKRSESLEAPQLNS